MKYYSHYKTRTENLLMRSKILYMLSLILEYRKTGISPYATFKFLNWFDNVDTEHFFERRKKWTVRHNKNQSKKRIWENVRKYFYIHRAVDEWNNYSDQKASKGYKIVWQKREIKTLGAMSIKHSILVCTKREPYIWSNSCELSALVSSNTVIWV